MPRSYESKPGNVFIKRMSSAKVLPKKKLTIKSGLENVTESMTTPYQIGERNATRQTMVSGSRLNVSAHQRRELETMYSEASEYARKSYGGNT